MEQPRLSLVASGAVLGKNFTCKSKISDEVHSELRRVLSSNHFNASERNRRFLGYIVEETLAGRHDRIKAYTIATTVFGRDDSFDPTLDPVVRMEARRLRRSLELFYLIEGQKGTVRIALPKGGYVPKFENSTEIKVISDQSQRSAVMWAPGSPSIFIAAFDVGATDLVDFRNGLARRIAVNLGRVPKLDLFMQLSGYDSHPVRGSTDGVPPVDLVLSGDIAFANDILKVTVTLLHSSSGKVVWAQTLVGDSAPQGLHDPRDKIADLVASAVLDGLAVLDDIDRPATG